MAEELEDLTLEVQDGAVLQTHQIILAARVTTVPAYLRGPYRKGNRYLRWPMVPLKAGSRQAEGQVAGTPEEERQHPKNIVEGRVGASAVAVSLTTERPRQSRALEDDGPRYSASLHRTTPAGRRPDQRTIGEGGIAAPPAAVIQPPRPLRDSFYLFGPAEQYASRWAVLRYDPRQQQPTERIADWEEPRTWATFSVVGDSIFVVGGWIGNQQCSPRVSEFVVRETRWCERAPLAVGRREHTAVVLQAGGHGGQTLLAVLGGWGDRGSCLSSCEVYDVSRDRWYTLPKMREERGYGPAAACLPGDNRVFVFGGYDGGCLDSVEFCLLAADWEETAAMRTTSDFWQTAAPMSTARAYLTASAFRGRFIVAGGWDYGALNTVELFSLPDASSPRGQWSSLADMQQPHDEFILLTSGNSVYALGDLGNRDEVEDNTIEVLSPAAASADAGTWRWSYRDSIGMLHKVVGAALLRQ